MVTKANLTKLILEIDPDAKFDGLKHSELTDLLENLTAANSDGQSPAEASGGVSDADAATGDSDQAQSAPEGSQAADEPQAPKVSGKWPRELVTTIPNPTKVAGSIIRKGESLTVTKAMMEDPAIGPKITHGIEHSKILKWQ